MNPINNEKAPEAPRKYYGPQVKMRKQKDVILQSKIHKIAEKELPKK